MDGAAGAGRRARAGGASAGLLVDIPALALGVNDHELAHCRRGLEIADTVVQDVAFVLAAVFCAQLGGRAVRAWQFGLRRPGAAGARRSG